GKFLRQLMANDGVKGMNRRQLRAHEGSQGELARRHEVRRAGTDMETNRQVETVGFFIDRKKIGTRGPFPGLQIALFENAAGAMIFGETQFFEGVLDIHQWRQETPP